MKRKERAHLKEDPLQVFVQKVLDVLKKYKHEIYIGLSIVGILLVVLVLTLVIKSVAISKENHLYTQALDIKQSETLTVDQKIERLSRLKSKRGISAAGKLFTAALYFEKGEIQEAGEILKTFKGSKFRLLEDQKKLLDADILDASGKKKEAEDLLFKMYSDPETAVARDYILLKMARLQVKTGQTKSAITNLKKIGEEFPYSSYSRDANLLLAQLENQ